MNDEDRAQWIDNDEGLYNWWRRSRKAKAAFIRENRQKLTEIIQRTKTGERRIDLRIPEE